MSKTKYFKASDPSSFTSHASKQLIQRYQDKRIINNGLSVLSDCLNKNYIKQLEENIHSTFATCHIDKIHQINHPQMYGMYLLRKVEMKLRVDGNGSKARVRERTMYHVTTEEKGLKSLENGLNWRMTRRSKFGHGVSFSGDADYADFYANSQNQSGEARTNVIDPFSNMKIPPGMVDTTISPEKLVYVKYNDYEFYPLYMVYYRCIVTDPWINRHICKNNVQKPKPQLQKTKQKVTNMRKQSNNKTFKFSQSSSKTKTINIYNFYN